MLCNVANVGAHNIMCASVEHKAWTKVGSSDSPFPIIKI